MKNPIAAAVAFLGDRKAQNQIKRTLSQPAGLDFVRKLLDKEEEELSRTDVALRVCEEFGFQDPRGQNQVSNCLKALRELEAKGHFKLPEAQGEKSVRSPRRLEKAVPRPQNVPGEVGAIVGLKLVRVEEEDQMRTWNELMIREHPQGERPLVGRQIRYLVHSDHGWLGALGFAAPALKLADRDRWIGWNEEQRKAYLDRVVCLSRFLIRPEKCQNLASRLLSMSLKRLEEDFPKLYKYEPFLVESFVDTSQFSGTSYRAANWQWVGQTQGRGRHDRFTERKETIKDIFVYPLKKDFRERLGLAPGAGLGPLGASEGVDTDNWAQQEMGGAELGDARLSKRLVEITKAKAEKPGVAYTEVAPGNVPALKAFYRFVDNPEVSMEKILEPHRQCTIRRMQDQRVALCVQDGTDCNYTSKAQCEGLGTLGKNQTDAKSRGLHLHTTFVLSPEGLPLGILRAECVAPELKSPDDKRPSYKVPIEEKDTFPWLKGLRDTVEVAAQMPQTKLINVCDREADFFELFHEQRLHPEADLLVRANHNRRIEGKPGTLFEAVLQSPVETKVTIEVDRQSARPKLSKKQAKKQRLSREAELEIRYRRVRIPSKYHPDKDPIDIWVISAREWHPPKGVERVEWFLNTTLDIRSAEDAVQCLRWYCLRWRIEDFHRVLKSGCGVEKIAHETAERISRAIAINLVIAWRIMLMTLLGREVPGLPPDVLFSDIELQVLQAFAKKKSYPGLKP